MNTDEIMVLVEAYRTAGGREEHAARQDHLRSAIDDLLADNTSLREQNTALDGAVAELDRANLSFARRELWWNEKMFELEEKLKWAHHTPKLLSEADAAADLTGVSRPGAEPYAYAVYFPDEAREELVHRLDDLMGDLTNCAHEIIPLYTSPQASQPAAQPGAEPVAWRQRLDSGSYTYCNTPQFFDNPEPVYTAPQASEPAQDAVDARRVYASPIFTTAIDALNKVKAWRDCDGNDGFPHSVREQIEVVLMAYESRAAQKGKP